ncbi:hypothetical protein FOZ62_002640, partial [Perkinsus olseni]
MPSILFALSCEQQFDLTSNLQKLKFFRSVVACRVWTARCDTAIGQLERTVREEWSKGYSVGAIFIDIEGAFDKCSTWSALRVLLERGVDADYLLLLQDYLSCREVIIQHGSDRCSRKLTRGTPQGGVTSPWIFNAFMLTFERSISPWLTVIYADDGVILFRYTDALSIQDSVNAISAKLDRWCLSVKCKLSWGKTRLMCFPLSKLHGGPGVKVHIGGHTISEECATWLGIHLDRKFKWGLHVTSVVAKIEGAYHSVKRHVRSTWGLLPEVAARFFDIIARGHLLHGVACWGVAVRR